MQTRKKQRTQILANSRQVYEGVYTILAKKLLVANTGKLEDLRCLEGALWYRSCVNKGQAEASEFCYPPAERTTSLLTAAWYGLPPCRNSTPVAFKGDDPSRNVILETVADVRTKRFLRSALASK